MAKGASLLRKIKLPARLSFLGYMGDVQGCGTIRVIIPWILLNQYRSHKNKLQCLTAFVHNFIPDVEYYRNFTFCQFQRSATDQHLDVFKYFKEKVQKKYNVPLVYEIDDMLIDIPEWNYANKYYKKNEDNVKALISMADAVMVSTPYLGKVYSKYNPKIQVCPNHLAKFIWGDVFPSHQYKNEKEKVKILWAGSQNHFHNPMITGESRGGDFGEDLLKFIIKTTDKYDWYFVGALPHELTGIRDKINFIPWVDVWHYPKTVKDIEPDIALAPLVDDEFNRCKSNIKQLEFSAMGAAAVYSNVEPYKNCYLKVRSDEEMIAMVEKLALDIDFRAQAWQRDRERVEMQLFWEDHQNMKRYLNTYLRAFGQRLP